MIWTAWSNGTDSFGLSISAVDRDMYFRRTWKKVTLELPFKNGTKSLECNVDGKSFWKNCSELRKIEIKWWFEEQRIKIPWKRGSPPKFNVEKTGDKKFTVKGLW